MMTGNQSYSIRVKSMHRSVLKSAPICAVFAVIGLQTSALANDGPGSRSNSVPLLFPARRGSSAGLTRAYSQPVPKTKKKPAGKSIVDAAYVPKPIGAVTLDNIEPNYSLPPKRKDEKFQFADSPPNGVYQNDPFSVTTPTWLHHPDGGWVAQSLHGPVAPFCYLPTYFEDRSLERFGRTRGCLTQSFLSGAEFFGRVPLLPYMMTVEPPWQHRPPNYLPPPVGFTEKAMYQARNISAEGVGVESLAVWGLFLLIP